MNENNLDDDEDETIALEQRRAGMFRDAITRKYRRGRTATELNNLIQNTIRYFHPDRRYDECLPSMMAQRRELVTLTDQYPLQNIIMNTDEEDILLTRIRCLRHIERPSLNTYDIWIRTHRRNEITSEIECTVMRGPVVTGIRTARNTPFPYPIWGINGNPIRGDPIIRNENSARTGGVQSLDGQYITTITHHLNNPTQRIHVQIGIFTLTQVKDLFPIIGVMYAMHHQLLESYEAKDWLWIRSYIEPIHNTNDVEQEHHQFNLRRPSL
jgi:hypothetical protein